MNKEVMAQGMIKVLDTYDITWGNAAIDKIINICQKSDRRINRNSEIHAYEPVRPILPT